MSDWSTEKTDRAYYERRRNAMINERSSFVPHWRELSTFVQPRAGRFFLTDVNRGDKRYQAIINSRATQSLRSATAGMFSGVMKPSSKWFTLTTPDPGLTKFQPVQQWLFQIENLMLQIFDSSNLYNMAPMMLRELLLFGTGAISQVDDFDDVTRFYTHTVGSYMIAQNDKFKVDTFCREFQMTVRQLVNKYGRNVSPTVMRQYDTGKYDGWIPVVHFCEPNEAYDPTRLASKFKKFKSVVYEPGAQFGIGGAATDLANPGNFLSEMGYDDFPMHCPRWDVTGEDVYATDCPGMTTLGDTKALQAMEREKQKAIQKMVSPPMSGPPSLRNVPINSLPGGATIYEAGANNQKLEPTYTVNPQIAAHIADIQQHEMRIKEGYYEDLFRSIDSMEGVQPQNELFLNQKNAEKLLQLGPVLQRIHGEFLDRVIDRTFNQCDKAGLFTGILAPPPQLQGVKLKVKYVSALATAMRSVETGGIDRLTGFIGGLVKAGFTAAADNLDVDETVGVYAHALGTPPLVLLDPAKRDAARQQKAADEAQQQKMMMVSQAAQAAAQGGQAANSLANAPTGNGGNALQAVAGAVAPALAQTGR